MNITDSEYTTKADVVVDIENADIKPEEKGHRHFERTYRFRRSSERRAANS